VFVTVRLKVKHATVLCFSVYLYVQHSKDQQNINKRCWVEINLSLASFRVGSCTDFVVAISAGSASEFIRLHGHLDSL